MDFFIIIMNFFAVIYLGWIGSAVSMDVAEFQRLRDDVVKEESQRFLGGSLTLNIKEQWANSVLMEAKHREYDISLANSDFPPAVNYFQAKSSMLQSPVFQFIQQMPKGYENSVPVSNMVVFYWTTIDSWGMSGRIMPNYELWTQLDYK